MRLLAAGPVVGLVLLAAAERAHADGGGRVLSPSVRHSVRCMVVLSRLDQGRDPTFRNLGLIGGMFFAGKAFGADPDLDLSAAAREEARDLSTADVKTALRECGAELQKRSKDLSGAGQALKRRDVE